MHTLMIFGPLLAMLVFAAVGDVRTRRIPNWLTLVIVTTGLTQSFTACATVSPWESLGGLLAGFGLTVALFVLGALGGGDVKLMAGCGAWFGPSLVFQVFVVAAIVGMAIVLVQSVWQGRLRVLLRNTLLVIINLIHIREVGLSHAQATGESCRSVDKPLPYAVPVLIAIVAVLCLGGGMA